MYETLYEYLIFHNELSIPGVGTFVLHRNPPVLDFPGKKINPATYYISHHYPSAAPPVSFFSWLGHSLRIPDREAVIKFNDFAFEIKRMINEGDTIDWKGVGSLNKGQYGEVKFTSPGEVIPEKPAHAEKVIREKAEHTVRVGEDERTSDEMTKMLTRIEEKKPNWWALALVIALLAVMFLGWYFSENGISVSSTGNIKKTAPAEAGLLYQLVP